MGDDRPHRCPVDAALLICLSLGVNSSPMHVTRQSILLSMSMCMFFSFPYVRFHRIPDTGKTFDSVR